MVTPQVQGCFFDISRWLHAKSSISHSPKANTHHPATLGNYLDMFACF